MTTKVDSKKKPRDKWAEIVAGLAGIRTMLSKKQDELDEAGIERKAIDLTPDIVDDLRSRLCEAFPAMCEGDGEAVAEVMQVIVDALAEAQPESDVDDERAGDDEEDRDDEKGEEIVVLTRQITEMSKAYNDLIEDVSGIVEVTREAVQSMTAQTKENNDLAARMAKIEKTVGERPRRASQAPETTLDPDSKLAKDIEKRDFSDVPKAFADMIPQGENTNG